ncbi:MAG: hypothetical protein LUI12_03725 [Clostridiales bacterium]|nr:hypothetical protein [Clostridiales bacterium]
MTILQIQAAVGTLVIAIIALITGNISDSYMGISISDFYFEYKTMEVENLDIDIAWIKYSGGYIPFITLASMGLSISIYRKMDLA